MENFEYRVRTVTCRWIVNLLSHSRLISFRSEVIKDCYYRFNQVWCDWNFLALTLFSWQSFGFDRFHQSLEGNFLLGQSDYLLRRNSVLTRNLRGFVLASCLPLSFYVARQHCWQGRMRTEIGVAGRKAWGPSGIIFSHVLLSRLFQCFGSESCPHSSHLARSRTSGQITRFLGLTGQFSNLS